MKTKQKFLETAKDRYNCQYIYQFHELQLQSDGYSTRNRSGK